MPTTGVISDYLENKIIDHTLRNQSYASPGTNVYVALFTDATVQNDANDGTEVDATAYQRVQVTNWDAPTSGSTSNGADINFPTAGANWGNIRYIGIFDASTHGNLLFWGQLDEDKDVTNGDTFSIQAEDLDIWLGGAFGYAASGSIINHVLRNSAMPVSGSKVYVALYTENPTAADTGAELDKAGYTRKNITNWSAPILGSGSTINTQIEAFEPAEETWGEITHIGIKNTEGTSGGDLLYYGPLQDSRTVGNGDTFRFSEGALSVTVD